MKKITFYISILLVNLVAFSVQAEVAPPVGSFQFKNHLELITLKKTEMVQTAARVQELKQAGWTCQQKTSLLHKCWVFLKNQNLPAEIKNELQSKYQQFALNFASTFSVEQTNQADFLQEYSVKQKVQFNLETIENYKLQVMKDGPTKLKLESKVGDHLYLISVEANSLVIQETLTINHYNESSLYLVEVYLEKP